jgi:hypothetical protein
MRVVTYTLDVRFTLVQLGSKGDEFNHCKGECGWFVMIIVLFTHVHSDTSISVKDLRTVGYSVLTGEQGVCVDICFRYGASLFV